MDSAWSSLMASAYGAGGFEAFTLQFVLQHLVPLEVYHFAQHPAHTLSLLSSDADEYPGQFVASFLKSLVIAVWQVLL